MNMTKRNPGVIFVAPGLGSQGGISAVVENFSKTPFWADFGCVAYASTAQRDSRWLKLIGDIRRLCVFSWMMIISKKPLVVSIHTAHDASFYRKFAYLLVCRLLRVTAVLHVHPAHFSKFAQDGGFIRQFIIRMADRMSDQIIVLSETIRSSLIGVFRPEKISVLHNPVDVSMYSCEPSPNPLTRPRVLFLGWITREKGVYDLVDAIPNILDKFPDTLFTFAGNKEVDNLKTLLTRRGHDKSAEVLGWVTGQEKIDLLRTSWVLALPSYTEGVPNVVLEAMASKLAIVTTPVGGLPDVLKNKQTALFVEPGNVDSLSNALIKLLADEELRGKLATAAFLRAKDCYSLEQSDRGLRAIYDRYRQLT